MYKYIYFFILLIGIYMRRGVGWTESILQATPTGSPLFCCGEKDRCMDVARVVNGQLFACDASYVFSSVAGAYTQDVDGWGSWYFNVVDMTGGCLRLFGIACLTLRRLLVARWESAVKFFVPESGRLACVFSAPRSSSVCRGRGD